MLQKMSGLICLIIRSLFQRKKLMVDKYVKSNTSKSQCVSQITNVCVNNVGVITIRATMWLKCATITTIQLMFPFLIRKIAVLSLRENWKFWVDVFGALGLTNIFIFNPRRDFSIIETPPPFLRVKATIWGNIFHETVFMTDIFHRKQKVCSDNKKKCRGEKFFA